MDIPNFFTEKDKIFNFNYSSLRDLISTDIDHSTIIEHLSPNINKEILLEQYFKSILLGYNHIYISKLLTKVGPHSNLCLPLLHKWLDKAHINNILIYN